MADKAPAAKSASNAEESGKQMEADGVLDPKGGTTQQELTPEAYGENAKITPPAEQVNPLLSQVVGTVADKTTSTLSTLPDQQQQIDNAAAKDQEREDAVREARDSVK